MTKDEFIEKFCASIKEGNTILYAIKNVYPYVFEGNIYTVIKLSQRYGEPAYDVYNNTFRETEIIWDYAYVNTFENKIIIGILDEYKFIEAKMLCL